LSPTNSSSSLTLLRFEIDTLRGFDIDQRTPSRPQCSVKIARMSDDRFEKK
jgi:hypothetical protein